METSLYGLFDLSADDRVEIRAGDLQEFLRQQMMGVANPGVKIEVRDADIAARADLDKRVAEALRDPSRDRQLQRLRREVGIRIPDMAEALDVSLRRYESYESGEVPIPPTVARKIAEKLGATTAGVPDEAVWNQLVGYIETIVTYRHADDLDHVLDLSDIFADDLMGVVQQEAKERGLEDRVSQLLARCASELEDVPAYEIAETIESWVKESGTGRDVEAIVHVRDWYMKAFPSDELGSSINPSLTFDDALHAVGRRGGFYDALGVGDSVVRERVFHEIAARYDVDYEDVYEAWMSERPVCGHEIYDKLDVAGGTARESLDEMAASMRGSAACLVGDGGHDESTRDTSER